MSWNITKNDSTPISDKAWEESIDDTGAVCRMEPIWSTMHQLERERGAVLWALRELDRIYRSEQDEPGNRPAWLQPFFEQNGKDHTS